MRPSRLKASVDYRFRLATGSLRKRPDFLIVGAAKAGTTSLYFHLLEHPQIWAASRKEVHFFDVNYARGGRWYQSHFPLRSRMKSGLTGEASPYYLFHPHAAERIAASPDSPKIIVLLRDPVRRAYSHFQHHVRCNWEQLSFADAIVREAEVLPLELEKMRADSAYHSVFHRLRSYVSRGCYAEQLQAYFVHLPRERILILRSEDFFADPQAIYSQVLRFLGIDQWRLDASRIYNIGRYEKGPIPDEAALRAYFEPHNRDLYALIGRDMGW